MVAAFDVTDGRPAYVEFAGDLSSLGSTVETGQNRQLVIKGENISLSLTKFHVNQSEQRFAMIVSNLNGTVSPRGAT